MLLQLLPKEVFWRNQFWRSQALGTSSAPKTLVHFCTCSKLVMKIQIFSIFEANCSFPTMTSCIYDVFVQKLKRIWKKPLALCQSHAQTERVSIEMMQNLWRSGAFVASTFGLKTFEQICIFVLRFDENKTATQSEDVRLSFWRIQTNRNQTKSPNVKAHLTTLWSLTPEVSQFSVLAPFLVEMCTSKKISVGRHEKLCRLGRAPPVCWG